MYLIKQRIRARLFVNFALYKYFIIIIMVSKALLISSATVIVRAGGGGGCIWLNPFATGLFSVCKFRHCRVFVFCTHVAWVRLVCLLLCG